MYWTHLIFALLNGLIIGQIDSSASKPGYLDFDNLPETNFSCDGKVIGGYYADVETGCQMFHVCTIGQKGEVTDIKFLCLNGTVFDQETRVCERIDEVDCSKSEDFFGLNLELYGNNAVGFGGIQAEAEFEAEEEEEGEEECETSDDCATEEDYRDDGEGEGGRTEEVKPAPTSGSTTTTTTSTTTTTTTGRPPTTTRRPYQSDHIQALLALHSALNKPPPPRIINNAFSPTIRPSTTLPPTTTQRPTFPSRRPTDFSQNFKSRYAPSDSQSYGSLNLQHRERPNYFSPSSDKSNYHHFQSGDTSFGHSFDVNRPYNFQYFHARKLGEENSPLSVVTSTSTSTSVKGSQDNSTEYPTGYEDYQDDLDDHAYFEDVPKLRKTRELPENHRYYEAETTTPRHSNHKYDDEKSNGSDNDNGREEFLHNLLGSIDIDENVREKMTDFFKKEDEEIEKIEKNGNLLPDIGYKIGQIFNLGMNDSGVMANLSDTEKMAEWIQHFNDMSKDINLNYTFESNFTDTDKNLPRRERRDTYRTNHLRSTTPPFNADERTQPRRTSIDTEKFMFDTRRKKPVKAQTEAKPVIENIEDDFTTVEYRRSSKQGRSQPRATTSIRSFTFNYEATTSIPSSDRGFLKTANRNAQPPLDISDLVHEDLDQPIRPDISNDQITIGRKGTESALAEEQTRKDASEAIEPAPPPAEVHRETPRVSSGGRQRARVSVSRRTRPQPATEESPRRDVQRSRGRGRPQAAVEVRAEVASSSPPRRGQRFQSRSRLPAREQPSAFGGHTAAPPYSPPQPEAKAEEEPELPPLREVPPRRVQSERRVVTSTTTTTEEPIVPVRQPLVPDPDFDCEGKVKGGFYADLYNDCRAFFICSQGAINGPLLKTHFPCGDKTKFNQRSRTCQAEDLVECNISPRYYHLNNDFLVPVSEDELKGGFEPMKEG